MTNGGINSGAVQVEELAFVGSAMFAPLGLIGLHSGAILEHQLI